MNTFNELIPRTVRIIVYVVFLVALAASDALTAGFSAAHLANPIWLIVGGVVLTKLMAAPVVVALFNVNPPSGSSPVTPNVQKALDEADSGNGASALKQLDPPA